MLGRDNYDIGGGQLHVMDNNSIGEATMVWERHQWYSRGNNGIVGGNSGIGSTTVTWEEQQSYRRGNKRIEEAT